MVIKDILNRYPKVDVVYINRIEWLIEIKLHNDIQICIQSNSFYMNVNYKEYTTILQNREYNQIRI